MQQPFFLPDTLRAIHMLSLCPVYKPTPMHAIQADNCTKILFKDETIRMGLGSFKALGGVYAVARLIQEAWERENDNVLDPKCMLDSFVREFASRMTFVCASAGNHGLAVAVGASIFGANARIHLAKNVPESFADRLRQKGAETFRSGDVYEDSMDAAITDSENSDAILLADGSWPGYVHPPALVMEGYTVLAEEIRSEFEQSGEWPTHIFLQAGVGGMAGAIAHMVRRNWQGNPKIIVVEPDAAPCLAASHAAGECVTVEGPVSNMGRLDCKQPSLIAFAALEQADVSYVTISDTHAQAANVRLNELGLHTTPSGAAGYAALQRQELPKNAIPLVVITERSLATESLI
ncbi:MAG: pyridoxal-phosphate dependent enzyme [Arenicella sp.]|nr:pyridoxal-phosphate dependent enzyme [Arenicella sp.]